MAFPLRLLLRRLKSAIVVVENVKVSEEMLAEALKFVSTK